MSRLAGSLFVSVLVGVGLSSPVSAGSPAGTVPSSDRAPIAVLVDTSQAMRPHLTDLRAALHGFFRDMQGTHQIALFEFGERPNLVTDYTTDVARLEKGIGRLFPRPGSGAYALDAIIEVSRGLRTREDVRPVIIVITADGPEFSDRYHQTVLDELRKTHASLHAFMLDTRHAPLLDDATREREFALAKGAKETGGRREDLLTSMALAGRLHNLVAELQAGS